MDNLGHSASPLLLRYAQAPPAVPATYRYDPELGVNVICDADGNVCPAVEGPDAGVLTKTQAIEGEE
jgi:putative ATP-grasp target RiPP